MYFQQIAIEAFGTAFASKLCFADLQRCVDLRAFLANAIGCTLGAKHFVALEALSVTRFMG